jgi:hypothetical protein
MNKWTNEQMTKWTNEQMNKWTNEQMKKWTNEQMHQLTKQKSKNTKNIHPKFHLDLIQFCSHLPF